MLKPLIRIAMWTGVALLAITVALAQTVVPSTLRYQWPAVTTTGQVGNYIVLNGLTAPRPSIFRIDWAVSGTAPGSCTFNVQGSVDNVTWANLDGGSPVSCTATGNEVISGNPVLMVRVNVAAYAAGNGTTKVVFQYTGGSSAGGNGGGGGASVTCLGSDDYPLLQTALNLQGLIIASGICVLPSSENKNLVIRSNTKLYLIPGTTLTQSGSVPLPVIVNAAYRAAAQRTFADAVIVAGSQQLGSATAAFASADKGNSIACDGALGSAFDYTGTAVPNVWKTTIMSIVSPTSVLLTDAPLTSINPGTCRIYLRDHDIVLEGGTLIQNTGTTTTAPYAVILETTNRATIKDMQLQVSGPTVGQKLVSIKDSSDFFVTNPRFQSYSLLQDGIDYVGPLHNGTISGERGFSGDDLNALFPVYTDANLNPNHMQGVIDNLTFTDIKAASIQGERAVGSAGTYPTGVQVPVTNITISQVEGVPYSGDGTASGTTVNGGFGDETAFCCGTFKNIMIDHVGGIATHSNVWIEGALVDNLKVLNPSVRLTTFPYNSGFTSVRVNSESWGPSVLNTFIYDGMDETDFSPFGLVQVDAGSSVNNFVARNNILANMTGGAFNPFRLYGNFDTATFENNTFVYNSLTTSASAAGGMIAFTGSNAGPLPGVGSANRVIVRGNRLIQGAGSADAGALLNVGSAGGFGSTVGQVQMSDNLVTGPALHNNDTLLSINGGTVNNYSIANSIATNIGNCVSGSATGTASIFKLLSSGITNASTCATTNDPSNVQAFTPYAATANQTATSGPTTIYTATSNNQVVLVTCNLTVGATTGTATGTPYIHTTALFPGGTALTLGANASETFSQQFTLQNTNTINVGVTYSGATSSYNFGCTGIRLQ